MNACMDARHRALGCNIYTRRHTLTHTYTLTTLSPQEFVLAFMMGTHSRLGARSPVLLLDAYVAASIAQIIVADKW